MPPRTARAGGHHRRPAVPPTPNTGKVPHRYTIEGQIAAGGHCEALVARDQVTGRMVALKRLHRRLSGDADARERLAREARVLQSIRHPGIVQLLDTRLNGPRPFIILELLGDSLDQRLRQGRVQDTVACKWITTLATAVDALHRSGVLHRDISPENVLLTADGSRVKLIDLGIARVDADDSLTLPGIVMGKSWYLPPEHATGQPCVKESDLYQLALVSYQLITGKRPWATEPRLAIGRPRPTGRGEQVDSVFARALARDPTKRYRSGNEFSKALTATLRQTRGPHAPPAKRSRQQSATARRRASSRPDRARTRQLPRNPPESTKRLNITDRLAMMTARLEQHIDWALEHAARLVTIALTILFSVVLLRVALEILP